MIDIIGFTGTSEVTGMTNDQVLVIHMLLGEFKEVGAKKAAHGMCIGADEQFHQMAKAFHYWMIGRPGVNRQKQVVKRANVEVDRQFPPKWMIDRNHDIVDSSSVMIATPKEFEEVMIGSGTWATIRYARKKVVPLCIVFPDGSLEVENVVGYMESLDREELVQLIARNAASRDQMHMTQYLKNNPVDSRD